MVGIGKSIFYDFFYRRYRKDHPQDPIVTAAFNKKQELKECVVFESNVGGQAYRKSNFPDIDFDYPHAIHLYDGPPKAKPANSKMVAFTGPNASWLDSMVKAPNHCRLYMPVWEYDELSEANDLLKLKISSDCLLQRYELFGGVPRYCLTTNLEFYEQGEMELKSAINKIQGLEDLQACSDGRMELDRVVHRLMHYVPNENPVFASLSIASPRIRQKILSQLQIKSVTGRKKLMDWLEGAGKASSFAGWLFEDLAHELLLQGGTFKWKNLESSDDFVDFGIDSKTRGTYERLETDFISEEIDENVYQMPKISNFKSIDSFMKISDTELLLFQMTVSLTHPIDPKGMVEVFEKLDMMDAVKERPEIVKLVFVVPERNAEAFKKQKFKNERVLSDPNLSRLGVKTIDGIGDVKKRKLDDMGITTCQKLMTLCEQGGQEGLQFVAKDVKMFLKVQKVRDCLMKIPQYVLKLKW